MKLILKLVFITTLGCLTLSPMYADGQKLNGRFTRANTIDGGRVLSFANSQFTDTVFGCVSNEFGAGNYVISKRELLLKYLDFPGKDSSAYTYESKPLISEDGKLTVKMFIEGQPVPGEVQMLDKKGKMIIRNKTNDQGSLSVTIKDIAAVDRIRIIGTFFYPVVFAKEKLLGRETEVRVDFKDAVKSYVPAGTIKYRLLKKNKNMIVMQSVNGEKLVFERIAN